MKVLYKKYYNKINSTGKSVKFSILKGEYIMIFSLQIGLLSKSEC